MANKRRKKLTVDKYNYGSYVIQNQQMGEKASHVDGGTKTVGGMASGAITGTQILPGWGTLIGGVIGAAGGAISAGSANKKAERHNRKLLKSNAQYYEQQYNSMVGAGTDNPYGVYEDGGDVEPLTQINIEKGELQVDPETGKILREYTGINPETGGLYEPHAKKGKDSKDNIVTAEEGTFIITKDKAKEYKDALNNKDTLKKNTIMQNIRNKKRQTMKFADGGIVNNTSRAKLSGVLPASNVALSIPTVNRPVVSNDVTTKTGVNWGNIGSNAINYLPSIINMIQGSQNPNFMQHTSQIRNPYINQIKQNMPKDINYTPLLNRIYRDRNTAYSQIDATTSSSAVARANKQNVYGNTIGGIADAYFQGEQLNNQTRAQRAGVYNTLGAQEMGAAESARQFNFGIDMTNRQMVEARRQQRNYGLSQLSQMYQGLQTNKQMRDREDMQLNILREIFPAIIPYLDRIGGLNG